MSLLEPSQSATQPTGRRTLQSAKKIHDALYTVMYKKSPHWITTKATVCCGFFVLVVRAVLLLVVTVIMVVLLVVIGVAVLLPVVTSVAAVLPSLHVVVAAVPPSLHAVVAAATET